MGELMRVVETELIRSLPSIIVMIFGNHYLTKYKYMNMEREAVIVEREVRRRKAIAAHQRIVARSEIIKNRTDTQVSSVDLIRDLREGKERRN